MSDQFDQDWYLDNVLAYASPGGPEPLPRGPAAQWEAWWRRAAMSNDVVRAAAAQGFVLTSRQLADLDVSRSATRTAIRHGRWWVPAFGTVAPLNLSDQDSSSHLTARRKHAVAATAAVLRRPDHVVSGRSAAILRGLPTLAVPDRPELTGRRAGRLGRSTTIHAFGATLPEAAITAWFGAPVTTVGRSLVELARHDRRDGLMAADAALRERLVTPAELAQAVDEAAGWPGVRQARALLELASPKSESPLESITRLALHDAGFPPPGLQNWVGAFRVDFFWPEQRLILEADGRAKYSDDELWKEKKRERALRPTGNSVERVVWADVIDDWAATEARLWPYFAG